MSAQSVIIPSAATHARYLTLRFDFQNTAILKQAIAALHAMQACLNAQYPDADINSGIAFGLDLWPHLYPKQPDGWHNLTAREGDFSMPAIVADVFVHITAKRADVCFALSQVFLDALGTHAQVLNETAGFRYLDSRDLTGFIDGTENPQTPEERAQAALLQRSDEFDQGSFVFAQRYVHHLPKWHAQSIEEQEKIIGRTKQDSVELDEGILPDNAHISRVIIEDESGEELAILRHSLPYGDASGESGLYFVSYTTDLKILDAMLDNMFGTSEDGLHDQFLHYTTPVDGAYFFMPSSELLSTILTN